MGNDVKKTEKEKLQKIKENASPEGTVELEKKPTEKASQVGRIATSTTYGTKK
ncbi:hypothetical protein [Inquilinus sp.]|uniref:hypothetical protein n=1 Tax=Inquilinus sp. TaxID=1932117 RepID=UPI0037841B10